MKTAEFENSVDPDEVAQNEPPHLDLHYLSTSLNSQHDIVWLFYFFFFFLNSEDVNFVDFFGHFWV